MKGFRNASYISAPFPKLSWRKDIQKHADYIGERRLSAGRRFFKATERAIEKLAERPMLGGSCEFDAPELADLRVWSIKSFEH